MITNAYALDTPSLLSLVIQVVLPLLVGLLTKASWSAGLKALLLLALTAVNEFVTMWYKAAEGMQAFDWRVALLNVIVGFVVAVAAHFGLWRPTGATDAAQRTMVRDGGPI